MDGTHANVVTHESASETRANMFIGGSVFESFGAVATVVLAIIALAGVLPPTLAGIATIIVGAAMLMESGAFMAGTAPVSLVRVESRWFEGAETADFEGGLAAIVLGILALLGIAPETLISVAVIALGAACLFSGRLLVGVAAVVLGIVSLVNGPVLSLNLIGLLVLGAGLFFTGAGNAASCRRCPHRLASTGDTHTGAGPAGACVRHYNGDTLRACDCGNYLRTSTDGYCATGFVSTRSCQFRSTNAVGWKWTCFAQMRG